MPSKNLIYIFLFVQEVQESKVSRTALWTTEDEAERRNYGIDFVVLFT